MYLIDEDTSVKYLDEFDCNTFANKGHDAFSPSLFYQHGQLILEKLTKHLADNSIKGLKQLLPSELTEQVLALSQLPADNHEEKLAKLKKVIDLYISTGIQVQSPGYMGRQFSSVIPLAGAFDLINSVINQPASFYEAAQLPNVVEKLMANEFNKFIGWPEDSFAMVTTSGGSLANLTAILAARNDKYPQVWSAGFSHHNGEEKPAIAVSADSHYSVSRAAGILGIGEDQIIKLPINTNKQIDIAQVNNCLAKAKQDGMRIFCLVAAAGSTAVGAYDDLNALADICQAENIWLHVDGAHGASVLVSDLHRHKVVGIERADSFVLDAHKMLFVPAMCTLLFYKNKQKSYGAFNQDASYVFEKEPDAYTAFDSAEQNFECTKRPLIMNLWICWLIHGPELFTDKINHLCHMTQQAYHLLVDSVDFSPLHMPEVNILCFRYLPSDLAEEQVGNFQVALRNIIRKKGTFFISKVDIDEIGALRLVLMNHEIKLEHIKLLLDEIRTEGTALLNRVEHFKKPQLVNG